MAWLFAAGVVVRIFLTGLALFDSALRWQDHMGFGYMIGVPLLLLLLLALIGRMPRPIIGMTVVLLVLYIVQITRPNLEAGCIAAGHPLVGFALPGMPVQLGFRIRSLAATD